MKIGISFALIVVINLCAGQNQESTLAIIPAPSVLKVTKGTFELTPKTPVVLLDPRLRSDADVFNEFLQSEYGFTLQISTDRTSGGVILERSSQENEHLSSEGYRMSVTEDRVTITGDEAGVFYGLQTLKQLLPVDRGQPLRVPGVEIEDAPRYRWRGMHLDVCRHFFPKEFVKKYIDEIAMYKMNTFHWHLTEDQGWRIEIKKYPKLTEIGAWRNGSMVGPYNDQKFDSVRYGGFYTQEDVMEIVAYAAKRHVTIVPEIEMPGHSTAALASYPWLSCTGGPFEVGKSWGVYDDVYCPKDETFQFLEDVLSEVCALFPGKYIHIGGDECPKERWKACPHCQALIRKEGLKDENELQSYFIRHIEKFLNSKGKQIIGWDEILEGGLAPNAAVMSWRGTEGGVAAAKQKHNVVMTPGAYCYFDHYQGNPQYEPLAIGGYTPLEKVYSYDPTPAELSPDEQQYILGAQGNVWTEYITSPQLVEYMALPRMAALAEVVWSPKDHRDYKDFQQRLVRSFPLLDSMGVNYSKALYDIKTAVKPSPAGNGVLFELSTPFDPAGICYTVDGSLPTPGGTHYQAPINITKNVGVIAAYFDGRKQKGYAIEQRFFVTKSTGKKIILKTLPSENYFGDGAITLVDGIRGDTARYGQNWLGWEGANMEAVIDLGARENFSRVTIDVFDAEASWIHFPKAIEVFVADDTVHFRSVAKLSSGEIREKGKVIEMNFGEHTARYVKVVAENAGKIPAGKPGAGNDAWLFVDEIMVE
jgi:hexosaminidase